MDHINTILEDLEDDEFKKLKGFLRVPENLDGQDPIGRALLQKKDRMEIAEVIVQTYPDNVYQIMVNVLGKVGRKDLQKQCQNNVQPKVEAVSVPATSKGATASGPEVAFVTKHQRALIQRVSNVYPILDLLSEEGIMKDEDYSNVRAEKTTQGKMRELFILLNNRGAKAKRVFYKGLEENEECLLEDLQG